VLGRISFEIVVDALPLVADNDRARKPSGLVDERVGNAEREFVILAGLQILTVFAAVCIFVVFKSTRKGRQLVGDARRKRQQDVNVRATNPLRVVGGQRDNIAMLDNSSQQLPGFGYFGSISVLQERGGASFKAAHRLRTLFERGYGFRESRRRARGAAGQTSGAKIPPISGRRPPAQAF
jgi:hypothetical protein